MSHGNGNAYDEVIRGLERRDQIIYDIKANNAKTINDSDEYDAERKNNDIRWIDELIVEPIQRHNAWTQGDILKLLD